MILKSTIFTKQRDPILETIETVENDSSMEDYSSQDSIDFEDLQIDTGFIDNIEFKNYKNIYDDLITFIIEKHNRDITFDRVPQFIKQQILQINQNTEKLINWLTKNQDKSRYIWFLGLFYYYKLGWLKIILKYLNYF